MNKSEAETDPQTQRADLWLPGGGKDWEAGISRCKLLYTGWVNKVLLYSTGPATNQKGKECKKRIYMCV